MSTHNLCFIFVQDIFKSKNTKNNVCQGCKPQFNYMYIKGCFNRMGIFAQWFFRIPFIHKTAFVYLF